METLKIRNYDIFTRQEIKCDEQSINNAPKMPLQSTNANYLKEMKEK